MTMGGNLNMRQSASLNSPVIDVIPNNTVVNVLDCEGKWYKILYNGNEGYVFKLYIALID